MHWKSKSWILIGVLLAAFTAAHAQIVTTQVADAIYRADGTPATGTALISWPAFTTSNGDAIPAGSTSAVIAAGGALSVQLIPNAGAIGSYYTVVYHLDDGSVSRQYWVVPASSSPVKVSAIESTVLPTSVPMQTVSKSYVDTAIAVAVAGHSLDSSPFTLKAGDTMTGPLVLPADPVSAMQAADKNYIDESVAAVAGGLGQKLSLGGDVGGTASAPVVTGIQGNPVSATAPAIGQALTWNGSAYVPAAPSGANFASPPAIGNANGVPQIVGVGTNYPSIPSFGGNLTYAAYGQSCNSYTLPNDNGGLSSSQCGYVAFDNSLYPGWNYGNPTAPLAGGWFGHGTFTFPNILSYSAGIHSAPGMYSGAWFSSGDFDGRRSYEIFKHATIAPSDEGIVLDGDSPQEAPEGAYTIQPYGGAWSSATTYPANEIVAYAGAVYISTVASNLNNPPATSPSQWEPVQNYASMTWLTATTYSLGQGAEYAGVLYTSLANANQGNVPVSSPSEWAPERGKLTPAEVAAGVAFSLNCVSFCQSMGINHPFIDLTQVTTNVITAYTATGPYGLESATVSTAVTPSLAGTLAANVLVPRITFFANSAPLLAGDIVYDGLNQQVVTTAGTTGSSAPTWNAAVGGTTPSGSVTFTNFGIQTKLPSQVLTATFNTTTDLSTLPTPLLCEVLGTGNGYQEVIGPDAFGPIVLGTYNSGAHTQTVTADWHYGHLSGSEFYCGGPVGEYIEYPQYSTGGAPTNKYVQQIMGATDAHTILFGYQGGAVSGFGSIAVPSAWLPETVNIYPGAEIYGVEGWSVLWTGANRNTWSAGDSVQAVNHISSSIIGNAFYETFNNPFAPVIHSNVIWQGYGGQGTVGSGAGSASVGSAEYRWQNTNPFTGYLGEYASGSSGPQGIYSAPGFDYINGPISYGMAFDQPPVAGAPGPCSGWAICFAGAPDAGRVSQTGGLFQAYGGVQVYYNYADHSLNFDGVSGGIKSNGVAITGLANFQITIAASVTFAANTCSSYTGVASTASTTTWTGLSVGMTVNHTPTTDVSGVTGWSPSAAGQLYFEPWPSAGLLNDYVCNGTGTAIVTGGSTTWNVSAK